MKKLFIDYHPKRVRVAMTENGELVEFYIERASQPKLVGNIYKGRVVNVLALWTERTLQRVLLPCRRN